MFVPNLRQRLYEIKAEKYVQTIYKQLNYWDTLHVTCYQCQFGFQFLFIPLGVKGCFPLLQQILFMSIYDTTC